jgi:tRNA-2-methylthio-N6-dimethylallyladenosine synthase
MSSFALVTFGCQMNQHDSARLRETLLRAGYTEALAADQADVVLLNTCSVREKAEQKLRSEVGRMALLKRDRPAMILGVTGCVAQQEGERLARRMPAVDLVVGPDNIAELPGLLRSVEQGAPALVRTAFDLDEPRFLTADPAHGTASPTAFVTVMKGCDERCSFCIVPTTRGPERYRPSGEILDEIDRLVGSGVREITLLGQTVNSYQDPSRRLPVAPGTTGEGGADLATRRESDSQFAALLRAIAARCPTLGRLRYTSPHPRHLNAPLIQAHRELAVLPKHVHLPAQSGSDRILKRMIRRYTASEYVERLDTLREAVPGLTVSTDIIVGFPGETEEDFDATLALVRKVGFVGVFAFKYSVRPGTPAERLEDDVPEEEKSRRLAAVFESAGVLQQRHLESLVGSVQDVLVEGRSKGGHFSGRAERNEIVHFDSTTDPTGDIVAVRVTEAFRHSLGGELVDPHRAIPFQSRPRPARRATLPVL